MPIAETDALRRLPPYVFAELDRLKFLARARGHHFVDLGIGSPDIPIHPGIIEALAHAAHGPSAHGYPSFRGAPVFLDAIGAYMQRRFGVSIEPAEHAIALSGAKEGIAQIIAATCAPGDVVLVPEIYYPVYARAAWLAGAEVRWVPMRAEQDFVLDLDAISAEDLRRAKLLIVNYPNNPTGACASREFYFRAVTFARANDLLLLSDVAYVELTFGDRPAPSALEIPGALDVTIEFHSCSKTFSMAGLRAGFAVGGSAAITALASYRSNVGYGTPTVVQHAAAWALDHRDEIVPGKVAQYRARRDATVAALAESGWTVRAPDAAMYLWLPVPEPLDDWAWVHLLLDEDGIVVTPGVAFGDGGRGWFRISLVRDVETLATAARAIGRRRAAVRAALPVTP